MFWDNINKPLLKKVIEAKRINLRVFKTSKGYNYRLNGNINVEGFKTHKEAITHAENLNNILNGTIQ